MKSIHKTLFLFLFLYAGSICAQNNTTPSKSFNLFRSDYFISSETTGNTHKFTMYSVVDGSEDSENVTFTLRPLTKESFIQNFFLNFAKFQTKIPSSQEGLNIPIAKGLIYKPLMSDSAKIKNPNYKLLEDEATKLFYMFVAQSIVYDDLGNEPIAGTINFKDSLKVLRRDIDHQSIDHTIERLRKVYFKDKKLVRRLIKKENFDNVQSAYQIKKEVDSLYTEINSLNTVQIKKEIDSLNIKIASFLKNGGSSEALNKISGKFEFSDLAADLNRRDFKKKKNTEVLNDRSFEQQKLYTQALNEVSTASNNLQNQKDDLKIYNKILEAIDSIILIEKKKKVFFEKLKKDHLFIEDYLKGIESIRWKIRNDIAVGLNFNSDDTLPLNWGDFESNLEEIDSQLIQGFRRCIYPDSTSKKISWKKTDCIPWSPLADLKIDRAKIEIIIALRNELYNLQNLSTPIDIRDSFNLSLNIKILRKTIKSFDSLKIAFKADSLYQSISRYQDNAKEIAKLYKNQLQITNQIKEPNNRDLIQALLKGLNDNPVFKGASVSIPDRIKETEIDTLSETLINVFNDYKIIIDPVIERLNDTIIILEVTRKNKIKDLAKQEDQLIFKGFKVDSIVIEINEGFIENILMVGKVDEYTDKYGHLKVASNGKIERSTRTLKFENTSPIGFSRKLDFDAIKGKKLITRGGGQTQYEMYIEDILTYVQQHAVGRRDYSPANQKVVLKNNTLEPGKLSMGLKKEATYRLFEAKIFSDFVGLDETAPNGLIQTEISKRINLITNRCSFLKIAGLENKWNWGFLSYIEPSLTLSKIEGNNKYLLLDSKNRFINNQYAPIKFTSTLKLKQFENFSASATANILLLDMPNIKSTFFFNWGFRYGRTGIQDSIRTATNGSVLVNNEAVLEYGVNTFDHSPELIWSIYADERYGFSMSWQHHWFYLRDNGFEQVANTTFFENQVVNSPKDSKQYNTFRFLTTLEQSSSNKGRLFFRYTYNWQQGFWNTGFHQAQVGYSFYLLGRPKD